MIDDLLFLSFAATLLAAGSRLGHTGSVPAPTSPFSACVQSRRQDGFYRGAIDVTESGHQCMNWTGVAGFRERYPGKGLGEHNQCRNPDGRIRPWCFFRNPRGRVDWGYCDCKQGSVRLQGGRSKLDGRVEVYLGGAWGSVCSEGWGGEDAAVACRQLARGMSGHARAAVLASPKNTKIHWRAVHCKGDETDLLQCPKITWNGGECSLLAAITCTQQQVGLPLPVRLVGGRSHTEGTVEVFHAGQWGSICDDQWDDNDAEVLCRQLGLSGVARAWGKAHFGKGSNRVWLDEVRCTGNELTLDQCLKSAWGEHNCLHSEDAGVSCSPLTDGTVRLVGGAVGHEGRLEIFYHGQWGTVCDDGWTDWNTQVACRQLGYRLGETIDPEGVNTTHSRPFGLGSGPIHLDDVSCTGKEPSLLLCIRSEWLHHDCTHQEDVSVTCNPERSRETLPHSVPVRLVGGESPKEGRVELYMSGQWGTVCDDGWTDRDAEVICRQLGFRGVAKARVMAYFGAGTGPIHVDNVKCSGEERSLADCIKQTPGTHNCRHSEDAGVICDYGELQPSYREVKDSAKAICGLRLEHSRQRRIIGGENSLRGGWPWQASIRLRGSRGDGRLVCGATLINTCWVLTSAHCFKRYGNITKQYKVRVGDYHSLVPEEYEEEYGVDQIILHPRYNYHSNDYDLALVHLLPGPLGQMPGECASFSRHVLPVCLPVKRERVLKQASNCHITGWGDTGRSYSKTLQQAALSLLPRRLCQQHFHGAFTSRMLCAGSMHPERHVDSCRGDSGGPLVCQRPGGGWVIYGITSWGHACRTQQSPGVYTKVSAFSVWIQKVIGRMDRQAMQT
ncbi:neurotrypsin isoform X1 [Takifugu flavidus]|uniref:neurotrypsin isoform X1 n=2 Tax=Takifugu flavidus TaxID=433684 RepID=UPI00254457BF|nr:neurotrypsin isoform X1 [Takifugu flavidus]XP_056891871.1 neurotrypsin isoform X1 [Takifugu flavidus]